MSALLHVLYRTHPGANDKRRPGFYSRRTALLSLQAALEAAAVPWTLTVVADGGVAPELDALVRGVHDVVVVRGGGAASSFRRCVDTAVALAGPADPGTVFWFAEDDYLYRPDAMRSLVEATGLLPAVDYFSLYAADGGDWHASHPSQPDRQVPGLPGGPVRTGATVWERVRGTTSTFGVRRDALLADARLLRLGSRAGAPWDGATWHALQGLRPYSWRHLLADLEPAPSVRGVAKVVGKPPMRVAVNLSSVRPPARRRVLVTPTPALAVHMEVGQVPDEAAWAALAADVSARDTGAREPGPR